MSVVDRLIEWAKRGTAAPQRVLLYPTNSCNLKCVFCYQQLAPYDYSDFMPKQKWLDLTEELCKMGVEVLQISGGGEPMLVPDTVLEMMETIKRHGVCGRLVTNGTVWKEEWVKKVIELNWDNIIFSIDGPDAKIHDSLRGVKGSFEKTVRSIKLFRYYKEVYKAEKPLLEFSTVFCKSNFEHIDKIIRLAHDIGVKVITFEPVFVSNPYVHKIKLTKEQRIHFMKDIVPDALNLARSLGIITNLESLINLKVVEETGNLKEEIKSIKEKGKDADLIKKFPFIDTPCFEPWLWPKIEANGEVGPCSTNMLAGENIKNKTFKEVWYGKHFSDFRKAVMENRLPDGCSNCVSTHVPLNKKIREELITHLEKNGRKN
ncbi:MAG: radical SAM protein [Nanoarchaeota archaeon]|nr:radical SAM protein [Nanoarchaeota archaeon]